ncbi:MAG: ribbon-helix-helix domain-containing protein [Alphaproteobacteria bacterium]|nr:ribbon-helix-helix domain-containing protein [Alphaproteobacteria bacterium]
MIKREETLSGDAGPCEGESTSERSGKSTLVSRNITVVGRRTSVRLEPEMWTALREIARREGCKIHDICSLIHLRKKADTSLTAAIRVFLMLYYRAASTEEGHRRAGHGNFDYMVQRAHVTADMMTWKRSRQVPPLQRQAVMASQVAHQANNRTVSGIN